MKKPLLQDAYLQAILNADSLKIKELYKDCFPSIKSYILSNSGTTADAKDIFQESILTVFNKAKEPGFQLSAPFKSYLFGVAKLLWYNQLKRKYRKDVTIPEDDTLIGNEAIDIDFEMQEKQKVYDKYFALLGEQCQRILTLHFTGHSMKEIATKEGLGTDVNARKKKSRCQQKLIDTIQQDATYQELRNN